MLAAAAVAMLAAAQPAPDPLAGWRGEWEGVLVNQTPGAAGAPPVVRARLSIGAPDPNLDGCAIWRTTYFAMDDAARADPIQIKDYAMCPGPEPFTFRIDEQNGANLSAALFGEVLYAPFLAGDVMLTSRYQRRGDAMTLEIVSGKAAGEPSGGVVSFAPASLQVLGFERVTGGGAAASEPSPLDRPPPAPDKTDPPRRAPAPEPDETPDETPDEAPDDAEPIARTAAADAETDPVEVVVETASDGSDAAADAPAEEEADAPAEAPEPAPLDETPAATTALAEPVADDASVDVEAAPLEEAAPDAALEPAEPAAEEGGADAGAAPDEPGAPEAGAVPVARITAAPAPAPADTPPTTDAGDLIVFYAVDPDPEVETEGEAGEAADESAGEDAIAAPPENPFGGFRAFGPAPGFNAPPADDAEAAAEVAGDEADEEVEDDD